MKVCSRCGRELDERRFSKRTMAKDGLQAWCKDCSSSLRSEYYEKNRDKVAQRYLDHRDEILLRKHENAYIAAERRIAIKAFMDRVRGFCGCVVCGNRDPRCLQFHHFYGEKKYTICQMTDLSKRRVKSEIRKCVILCSCCHDILHHGYAPATSVDSIYTGEAEWVEAPSMHSHKMKRQVGLVQ